MTAESGNKPAAAQVDYSKRRHQPEKDDLELSAAGLTWLASIERSARPIRLAAAFPRIVNRMAKLWKVPREMDRYFEELLADTRGNRKGFPLNILMELSTLKDHYQAKVFPTRHDAWDS
jgi:propanediol dehydratase small subunit